MSTVPEANGIGRVELDEVIRRVDRLPLLPAVVTELLKASDNDDPASGHLDGDAQRTRVDHLGRHIQLSSARCLRRLRFHRLLASCRRYRNLRPYLGDAFTA